MEYKREALVQESVWSTVVGDGKETVHFYLPGAHSRC